jgi:hypothetical protein
LAVRLIDEGLRMADHPGVVFHDSLAHGRVACLVGGPDVAEVIDVLTGLESRGEDRVSETARWFGVHPARCVWRWPTTRSMARRSTRKSSSGAVRRGSYVAGMRPSRRCLGEVAAR